MKISNIEIQNNSLVNGLWITLKHYKIKANTGKIPSGLDLNVACTTFPFFQFSAACLHAFESHSALVELLILFSDTVHLFTAVQRGRVCTLSTHRLVMHLLDTRAASSVGQVGSQ